MQFHTWDTLFNILILLFWSHLWFRPTRNLSFNPYLAQMNRLSSVIINFLKPAFFVLPDRAVAFIGLLFLMVLRAFAAPRGHNAWVLKLGFDWRQVGPDRIDSFLIFSVLSFAIFLFSLWAFSLFFVHGHQQDSRHTVQSIDQLAQPFTRIPYEWRPGVLVGFGMLIVLVLTIVGHRSHGGPIPYINQTATIDVRLFLFCAISTLSAVVDILDVLVNLMILLIIGSWVSLFTGSRGIAYFCQEWIELILGPMRRFPVRVGMLDLSPIIYMFVLMTINRVLQTILYNSYRSLL
ncbi:MAG: YggT family protein [Verrucomicrobia bacterium]|nr:YggT family protein [Verrucomicrobiota bacterium]